MSHRPKIIAIALAAVVPACAPVGSTAAKSPAKAPSEHRYLRCAGGALLYEARPFLDSEGNVTRGKPVRVLYNGRSAEGRYIFTVYDENSWAYVSTVAPYRRVRLDYITLNGDIQEYQSVSPGGPFYAMIKDAIEGKLNFAQIPIGTTGSKAC